MKVQRPTEIDTFHEGDLRGTSLRDERLARFYRIRIQLERKLGVARLPCSFYGQTLSKKLICTSDAKLKNQKYRVGGRRKTKSSCSIATTCNVHRYQRIITIIIITSSISPSRRTKVDALSGRVAGTPFGDNRTIDCFPDRLPFSCCPRPVNIR